jgi:hypothetical protein
MEFEVSNGISLKETSVVSNHWSVAISLHEILYYHNAMKFPIQPLLTPVVTCMSVYGRGWDR